MIEWKDDGEMSYIEYLRKVVEETDEAIKAGDPDGELKYLREGIDEYLAPYSKKAMADILEEDPTLNADQVAMKLVDRIMPLIKQFTLDKMNSILLRDGYYDPVNKVLQTRFPPNSDVEKGEFTYETDKDGDERFGLKYTFKDGSFMFFDADMLERVNEKIMNGGFRTDDKLTPSSEIPT